MESLCSIFKKTFIFPIEFYDFIIIWGHLEATLGNFWVTLGLLWVYDGGFGSLLGHFGVILGSLWAHDAYMWGLGGAVFDLVLAR